MSGAAPAAGGRIAVLDAIRGVAILGIVLMNVPWQAASIPAMLDDVRAIGWTPADRATWIALDVLVEGTQRCLLELLFGAGVLLLGERLGAWAYIRRTLLLFAIGLVDIFVLLWTGDILAAYALAGLIVFPLRRLETRKLVALGLVFALWSASYGAAAYSGQQAYDATVAAAEGGRGSPRARQAIAASEARQERADREAAEMAVREKRAHAGGLAAYAGWYWWLWVRLDLRDLLLVETVAEAAATMLLGMALLRTGVLQGERSARFYLAALTGCYGIGLSWRIVAAMEVAGGGEGAQIGWIVAEPARLLVGCGHLCAIHLAWRSAWGRRLLQPFAAAGRTALSLYLLAQAIGLHMLFAPYGLGLWGRYGWRGMSAIAVAEMALLLLVANLWSRRFGLGPVEWLWRSAAEGRLLRLGR